MARQVFDSARYLANREVHKYDPQEDRGLDDGTRVFQLRRRIAFQRLNDYQHYLVSFVDDVLEPRAQRLFPQSPVAQEIFMRSFFRQAERSAYGISRGDAAFFQGFDYDFNRRREVVVDAYAEDTDNYLAANPHILRQIEKAAGIEQVMDSADAREAQRPTTVPSTPGIERGLTTPSLTPETSVQVASPTSPVITQQPSPRTSVHAEPTVAAAAVGDRPAQPLQDTDRTPRRRPGTAYVGRARVVNMDGVEVTDYETQPNGPHASGPGHRGQDADEAPPARNNFQDLLGLGDPVRGSMDRPMVRYELWRVVDDNAAALTIGLGRNDRNHLVDRLNDLVPRLVENVVSQTTANEARVLAESQALLLVVFAGEVVIRRARKDVHNALVKAVNVAARNAGIPKAEKVRLAHNLEGRVAELVEEVADDPRVVLSYPTRINQRGYGAAVEDVAKKLKTEVEAVLPSRPRPERSNSRPPVGRHRHTRSNHGHAPRTESNDARDNSGRHVGRHAVRPVFPGATSEQSDAARAANGGRTVGMPASELQVRPVAPSVPTASL